MVIAAGAFCVVWLLAVGAGRAEVFDWRDIHGRDFTTPTRRQIDQACWAYAAIGALEAKYKITRNDPSFALDLSELHLIEGGHGGSRTGGWPSDALDWIAANGAVREEDYPLRPDWRARTLRITGHRNNIFAPVAEIKRLLKEHGPLATVISVDDNWWPAPGPRRALHAVVVVGYCDDPSVPGGGYWIVKNSWREGDDWRQVPFSVSTLYSAITGSVYYTAPLQTVVWDTAADVGFQGGAGLWSTDSHCWSADGTRLQPWRNGEDAAVFKAGPEPQVITLRQGLSAHGLLFEPGARYTLEDGSLIVTAGGIIAGESVIVRTPLTVGAPQQWRVAAGKLLQVEAPVDTHISSLVFGGEGEIRILGALGGKGSVTKTGPGTLLLAAGGGHRGTLSVEQGTLAVDGLLESSSVTVAAGAALRGAGTLAAQRLIVQPLGVVEPGASIGELTVWGDLHFGGTLRWQLAGLADNSTPQAAGTVFDRLLLDGGRLILDSFRLELEFLAEAAPQEGLFWAVPRQWTIISGFGELATSGQWQIAGYLGPLGTFGLELWTEGRQELRLTWTPVPEPTAGLMLLAALAARAVAFRVAARVGVLGSLGQRRRGQALTGYRN